LKAQIARPSPIRIPSASASKGRASPERLNALSLPMWRQLKVAFEGPFYEISQFVPHYAIGDWPSQVSPSQILSEVSVMLTRTEEGYVTWLPRIPAKPFVLSELDGSGTRRFSAMAVQLILSLLRLVDHPGDTVARFHVATSPLGIGTPYFAKSRLAWSLSPPNRFRRRPIPWG